MTTQDTPPDAAEATLSVAAEGSHLAAEIAQPVIFIIEDDPLMAECLARALSPYDTRIFPDAVQAIAALSDTLPDLVLLDVLLNGPDGFTFLNEMISYSDTANIPVIIVTSLSLADKNLSHYGVRAVLSKDTFTPADIQNSVRAALNPQESENAR